MTHLLHSYLFYICLLISYSLSFDPESTCNEQGLVFRDSNYTICDCFNCFYGDHCEFKRETCVVDASDGNPLIYNEYWQKQTHTNTVIDAYYRTGYQFNSIILFPPHIPIPKHNGINYYLRESILNIHELTGNVNTDNKFIVIGNGATQLINAIIYAFHKMENKVLTVFAQTPYYSQYKDYAQFNPSLSTWNASYSQSNNVDLIEFVTIPNNPTGRMNKRYYPDNKYTVYDMVYDWPSIALNTTENANFENMIFSMSKLSGDAGTRIGWAFITDARVAIYMAQFIALMNIAPSIDAMYRTLVVLQHLSGQKMTFFNTMRSMLHRRWDVILPLFNAQRTYCLLSEYGSFYLWVKINDTSVNLYAVLLSYHILGSSGGTYGATDNFCRIEIVQPTATFNVLVQKLKILLADKDIDGELVIDVDTKMNQNARNQFQLFDKTAAVLCILFAAIVLLFCCYARQYNKRNVSTFNYIPKR